jgi:hypothetical protein
MQAGFGTGVAQSVCMLVAFVAPDARAAALKLVRVAADIPSTWPPG